jgi:hypothetical protein
MSRKQTNILISTASEKQGDEGSALDDVVKLGLSIPLLRMDQSATGRL